MTLSELIESLQTAKYESGGDPEVPFDGAHWDGESVTFIATHPADPAPAAYDPDEWSTPACPEHGTHCSGPTCCCADMHPPSSEPTLVGAEITDEADKRWNTAVDWLLNAVDPNDYTAPFFAYCDGLISLDELRSGHLGIDELNARREAAEKAAVEAAVAQEAARPFMTSRPALDWDQVAEAIATKAMHYDSGTPFDQVDREDQAGLVAATDAVMALAVPVPTEDEIVGELSVAIGFVAAQTAARAALALLNGTTNQPEETT